MKTNYILLFALMLMVSLKSSAQIFSGRVIGENQLPGIFIFHLFTGNPDFLK